MPVFDELRDIVAAKLSIEPGTIKPESAFVEDLNADSLDLADLVMEIEDKFSLTFDDTDTERFRTVGDVVKVIEEKKG
jgi:acyl carrier protein